MTEHIKISSADRILHLQFNRPERKNAITRDMYSALAQALNDAAVDNEIRVVLLSGSDSCFTAGNDLQDFLSGGELNAENPVAQFMQALFNFPKPVVEANAGASVLIGTTLLMQCDLDYADQKARLQMPFVNLGLVPEYGSSSLIPSLIGQAKAAELFLLGESFDAKAAIEFGLVNEQCEDALAKAKDQAARLVAQPPAAVRATKALMRAPTKEQTLAVMEKEFVAFGAGLAGAEFKEAATAFLEKRKPDFSSFN